MPYQGTLQITEAVMRAGKSFRRGAYELVRVWLKDSPNGIFITNVPLNLPAICEYCKRYYGWDPDKVTGRVFIIPKDMCAAWQGEDGTRGPWELFDAHPEWFNGRGARFVLDEANYYIGKGCPKERIERFAKLCRASGHYAGLQVEILTQNSDDIDKKITALAETWCELYPVAAERVRGLGITMDVVYNVEARVFRRWRPFVRQIIKMDSPDGLTEVDRSEFSLDAEIYKLYDSYSALDGRGGQRELKPWEKHQSAVAFWSWVFDQTWKPLGLRLAGFALAMWLTLGGGFVKTYNKVWSDVRGSIIANNKPLAVSGGHGGVAEGEPAERPAGKGAPAPVASSDPKASPAAHSAARTPPRGGAARPADVGLIGRWARVNDEWGRVGDYFAGVGAVLAKIDPTRRMVIFADGQRLYGSREAAARARPSVDAFGFRKETFADAAMRGMNEVKR